MAAAYLIDGYNLLYALGVLRGRTGPHGLEKARHRLLGLLAGTFGDDSGSVTVVFDAANAPRGASGSEEYRGVQVRYAIHQDEADDLIEELIRQSSAPRQLTVVSDDHRVQQAARRRACQAQCCPDFIDWVDRRRRQRPLPPPRPEKQEGLTAAETQQWVAEFAGLEDSADFKKLFEPYAFEE